MPIYEYQCQTCGAKFDAFRSFKEADNLIECKKCNSTDVKRMLSKFFAHSDGRSVAGSGGGCAGCAGGSCASCGH